MNQDNITITGGLYTPDEDVVGTLPDGRTVQLAVKGKPMQLSDAIAHGLVDAQGKKIKQAVGGKAEKGAGPSETKENPKKDGVPPPPGPMPFPAPAPVPLDLAVGSAPSQIGK